MSLLYCGIDEAGFGPLLGPMCVAMCALRIEAWRDGDAPPDPWALLAPIVSREPGRTKGVTPIPVADSKRLKLPNSVASGKPLLHLERGVLSFLRASGLAPPGDDEALFDAIKLTIPGSACYRGESTALPTAWRGEQVSIAANQLGPAMRRAGVSLAGLSCLSIDEPRFNSIIEKTGSKASVSLWAVRELIHQALAMSTDHNESVRLVCDRLGGREDYTKPLERMLPGASVAALEHAERHSRYSVTLADSRVVIVHFQTEAESAHFPVALASMTAKYARELLMARFNRYFGARARDLGIELKPTAGYTLDARRWLADARDILSDAERSAIVRNA
ncbi:MAG: hypothetical protein IT432_03545 [Phycisphaerales bacterium]|nr:hypothetical protein [Phycisphaerales bacterium]